MNNNDPYDLSSFYQMSDIVPSSVIKTVTKNCDKADCKISCRMGETTLMGISTHYNKEGLLIVEDRNRFTCKLMCMVCRKGWIVDNKSNIIRQSEWDNNGSIL